LFVSILANKNISQF